MITISLQRLESPPCCFTEEQREYIQNEYPLRKAVDNFFVYWYGLRQWYKQEASIIGEKRAFWGVVYRLCEKPDNDDITYIASCLLIDNDIPAVAKWVSIERLY